MATPFYSVSFCLFALFLQSTFFVFNTFWPLLQKQGGGRYPQSYLISVVPTHVPLLSFTCRLLGRLCSLFAIDSGLFCKTGGGFPRIGNHRLMWRKRSATAVAFGDALARAAFLCQTPGMARLHFGQPPFFKLFSSTLCQERRISRVSHCGQRVEAASLKMLPS